MKVMHLTTLLPWDKSNLQYVKVTLPLRILEAYPCRLFKLDKVFKKKKKRDKVFHVDQQELPLTFLNRKASLNSTAFSGQSVMVSRGSWKGV